FVLAIREWPMRGDRYLLICFAPSRLCVRQSDGKPVVRETKSGGRVEVTPMGTGGQARHLPPLTSPERAIKTSMCDVSSACDSRGRRQPNQRRSSSAELRPPEIFTINDVTAKRRPQSSQRSSSSRNSSHWIQRRRSVLSYRPIHLNPCYASS